MASVLLYHVVGDLTVGKPELDEFPMSGTVESAIRAIGESTEGGIPVWKKKPQMGGIENSEARQNRFVGILTSLDIVAFLAQDWCLEDQEKAMKTPVSEFVVPNHSLLKLVDPATRLIDALDMMKQGVKCLLVPKSGAWKCVSRKFSVLYNGKWLKNLETSSNSLANLSRPPTSSSSSNAVTTTKFCCLSREDIARFLIVCLGALAPIPLSTILSLDAISPHFYSVEASLPALEAARQVPREDPNAVAVVEPTPDGQVKIIGEISSCKLWKCDYLAAAHALASLSSGQFVMGVEDNVTSRSPPDLEISPAIGGGGSVRPKKFSSRSIGFFSSSVNPSVGPGRSLYRGRSAPLTCKDTSSLAAVMAQMLSHRATHVWVTEGEDDILIGVIGYGEILHAVSRPPSSITPST